MRCDGADPAAGGVVALGGAGAGQHGHQRVVVAQPRRPWQWAYVTCGSTMRLFAGIGGENSYYLREYKY